MHRMGDIDGGYSISKYYSYRFGQDLWALKCALGSVAPTKWGATLGSENRGIRLLYWSHTANREPVALNVVTVTQADVPRFEVQIVGAVGIVRSRRPIAAFAATTVHPHPRRTNPLAGINEVIWEGAPVLRTLRRCIATHLLI